MAEVMLSKNVLFVGAWRVHNVTDYLHTQISEQLKNKKGFPSRLDITSSGLELIIMNSSGEITRNDNIPLQNIRDFSINRHSVTTCLMATVANRSREVNVLVFLCAGDGDASEMVRTYQYVKNKLSGEGFNFDLKAPAGTNWTMKTSPRTERRDRNFGMVSSQENKEGVFDGYPLQSSINSNSSFVKVNIDDWESGVNREMVDDSEKELYNVGVQAGVHTDDDLTSTSSEFTSQSSLKDDLHQLSEEVRAIKIMLEDATGVSATAYFRRQKSTDKNDNRIHMEPIMHTMSGKVGDENGGKRNVYEDGVDSYIPNHDIRSYGTQTFKDFGLHRFRGKDQHLSLRPIGSSLPMGSTKITRGDYRKRAYDSENPLMSRYILAQHAGRRHHRHRKGKSLPPNILAGHRYSSVLTSTVAKPIEDVYGHHHHSNNAHHKISRSKLSSVQRSTVSVGDNGERANYREIVIGLPANGEAEFTMHNGDDEVFTP